MDCAALPKGWKREEIVRKKGLSAGKIDVYYYSPAGKKFRSKPQLSRYLGDAIDLSTFDFRTGKINSLLLRKSKRQRGTQFDYSRGMRNDASLVPPIRQTASIFKQPVTVYKSQESKVKSDFKHGPQEKPKQVFWEKRLQGLKACDRNEEAFHSFELPRYVKGKIPSLLRLDNTNNERLKALIGKIGVGPNLTEETLLRSIATALHVNSLPITGQTGNKALLEKNPGVFINPDQPLVQALIVSEDDIQKQEERVHEARKRLEEALSDIQGF